MVEQFDPRDFDWKPLPLRPDIAGQYVRYSELVAARSEIERLRSIIDNLHAVEEKYREAANAEFHRVNRLQVDNERLTKERDEARALEAAAYKAAAKYLQSAADDWRSTNNELVAKKIEDEIPGVLELTSEDNKAALEAYSREGVQEGMQQIIDRLCYEGQINPKLTYVDAIEWAKYVLAEWKRQILIPLS